MIGFSAFLIRRGFNELPLFISGVSLDHLGDRSLAVLLLASEKKKEQQRASGKTCLYLPYQNRDKSKRTVPFSAVAEKREQSKQGAVPSVLKEMGTSFQTYLRFERRMAESGVRMCF